jgi:hypothetical protein
MFGPKVNWAIIQSSKFQACIRLYAQLLLSRRPDHILGESLYAPGTPWIRLLNLFQLP